MGKRIIARARGHGSLTYKAPSHRYLCEVRFLPYAENFSIKGKVIDILDDVGKTAPVALIKLEDGREIYHIAVEGLYVGQEIKYNNEVVNGNVVQLKYLPLGTKICCIENFPGSGPKFCRSAGSFATVVGQSEKVTILQLPSDKTIELDNRCRCIIGVPAGSGIKEKPWLKAGDLYRAMKARNKLFPRTKGVVMNPVDHPWGGKSHRPRPSRAVSRNAPPGAKVGSISPKKMGKKKKS
ncbi:MAG: 50S ribosomal protein L2 [Candidatus Aenigmarchaeota archaeon]|nr:50S ribosomal protein L2 [Candidatus Aenigmarchaeota archaeon]MDW8149027.1 50S ribosomal protein L2 [Candidatus Aenigmarchaeota archaeon]